MLFFGLTVFCVMLLMLRNHKYRNKMCRTERPSEYQTALGRERFIFSREIF